MLTDNKNGTGPAKPIGPVARSRRFFKGLFTIAKPAVTTTSAGTLSQATAGSASDKSASIMKKPAQKPNEVVELVNALRSHMEQQSNRSERLLDKMEGLPAALESLPRTSQTGERMLETMQQHIELQQNHSERLVQVIESMSTSSKHRDQTINMLQRQITAAQEKDAKFMSGFETLGQTMSKMGDVQAESASMLQRIAETANHAEKRMRDVIDTSRRQAWTGLISVGAMAAVLLAMTTFVALSITRNQSAQPTAADPPASAETAQPAMPSPPAETVEAALTEPDAPAANDDAADAGEVAPAASAAASAEADATESTSDSAATIESSADLPSVANDELAKIDPQQQTPILNTSP